MGREISAVENGRTSLENCAVAMVMEKSCLEAATCDGDLEEEWMPPAPNGTEIPEETVRAMLVTILNVL